MLPTTAKTNITYQPVILKRPQPISSSTQATVPIPSQKNVSSERVKSTLERSLHIVSKGGESLGTINLPVFLRHLHQGLHDIQCPPKHFDVTGGGVAFLIGPKNAQKYADLEGISHPDLSEFDRLQDLDISVDLSEHSQDVLFSMCYCVIKALQKSGIPIRYSELVNNVFLRKKITENKDLCILSIGDPNGFWVDFSFIIRGRRHLFVRDNLKCDLTPYLLRKKYDLTWTTTAENTMQPIRNRMEKKLDMDDVESINHLGYPLANYYAAKGYQISEPDNLTTLAQKFIDFHELTQTSYADTFENIRKNHIGDKLDIYNRMAVASLRELLSRNNPQLKDWINTTQLQGDSPECRLFSFIKNGGMEKYRLSPSDIFCLADLMGVKPTIPFPNEAWTNFLQKKLIFTEQDSLNLFSSPDSFPLLLAKRIQPNALTVPTFSTQELLDLLETYDFNNDKKAFLEIKFAWECKHSPQKALETFNAHRNSLPQDAVTGLLNKILRLDCRELHPYFPKIFSEPLDDKLWIEKLIKENFSGEAIQLTLKRNSLEIYTFLLEKFLETIQLKDFVHALNQISIHNPPLHKELMQHISWKEKFMQYLIDETDFNITLKASVDNDNYAIAEDLLKIGAGKFTVPTEILEKILAAKYLILLQNNDFENLAFLIRLSMTSKVKEGFLSKLSEDILNTLLSSKKDPLKIEWAINFFNQPDLTSLISLFPQQFMELASSCLDKISAPQAEFILKMALDIIPSSNTSQTMKVIRHCMLLLKFQNKKSLSGLTDKLVAAAEFLVTSKDSSHSDLLQLLKEVRALKIKLPLPRDTLLQMLKFQTTSDTLLEFMKVLEQICPLPEDIKQPLLEDQLIHLALAKPKQAHSLFETNYYLWSHSKEALKNLFDKLPAKTPLKYAVFLSRQDWELEDWKNIVTLQGIDETKLLKIFIDPRARKFVNDEWIRYFIFTKNGSMENSHRILATYDMPSDKEFLIAYLNKLKDHEYPIEESQEFIQKFILLKDSFLTDPSILKAFKEAITGLHKKSPFSLVDTIFDLEPFLAKLAPDARKEIAVFYLEHLPKDFNEEIYSPNERAQLNHLIDTFEIQSPFSVYLGLTDGSTDRIQKAIQSLVEQKMYTQNKPVLITALSSLSKVLSKNPPFWIPVGCQFFNDYLSEKSLKLSSQEVLQALSDSDFPNLQHLCLIHALKVDSSDYDKLVLSHLENLIEHNQLNFVDEIISNPNFSRYLQNGYLLVSFKKMVEKFFLKVIENSLQEPDEKKKIQALKGVIQKLPLCNYKDLSFDKLWKQYAQCIGRCLLTSNDKNSYFTVMMEFADKYSQLYGTKELNTKERSALTKGTISPALVGKVHPNVSKFQLEIVNVLLTDFNNFMQSPARQEEHLNIIIRLFKNIMPKLSPQASEEFYNGMYIFFHNFFSFPGLYQEVEMCKSVFGLLNEAKDRQLYTGAYAHLLKTANCFSGLTFNDIQLTEPWLNSMVKTFNGLYDDKAFAHFWKQEHLFVTTKETVQNYGKFLNNLFYVLPPTNPYFPSVSKNLVYVLADIKRLNFPTPHPTEILAWSLYLGHTHNPISEKTFIEVMDFIVDDYPQATMALSFSWLLERYHAILTSSKLTVSEPIIIRLNKLLGKLTIGNASLKHVVDVTNFLKDFLPYCEGHMIQPDKLGSILTQSILKWLLPAAQDDMIIPKSLQSLAIIKKLSASKLSRGSSIIFYGSLRKLTEFICGHYQQSQKPQIGAVLLDVLSLTLNSSCAPDPESRQLWETVIYNICEKIITTIGGLYTEKLVEALRKSQITQLLTATQIEKLHAALKKS